MKRDSQVFDLISEERNRQMHGIELIASENFVSDEVMEAMGSVLTNKYAEGYPAARYYGGCQVVDKAEGVECRADRIFSVQYHPESAPGPQDSTYLFDKFIKMMEESQNA